MKIMIAILKSIKEMKDMLTMLVRISELEPIYYKYFFQKERKQKMALENTKENNEE